MTSEKKEHSKRSSGHAAKIGKSHLKVVKRNLIQSSELAQRDLANSEAGPSEPSNGPKRGANARGSSSKGAGGAKGNGNRQHKF